MSSPAPNPDLIARALTLRAAASLLSKSPIWAIVTTFMQSRLARLDDDILNNVNLSEPALHDLRANRFYLRQLLIDLRTDFHRAFTSPPPSEDTQLQKMTVPPEVEAALQLLITPISPSPHLPVPASNASRSDAGRSPAPAPDPANFDPFTGKPPTT